MKKADLSLIPTIAIMVITIALGIFLVGLGFTEDTMNKDLALTCICVGFFGIVYLSFRYGQFIQDLIRDRDEEEQIESL